MKKTYEEWYISEGEYTKDFASDDFLDDEFNLKSGELREYYDKFYPCVTKNKYANGIHVIEYAAYEMLEQRIKKLKDSLKRVGAFPESKATQGLFETREVARQALIEDDIAAGIPGHFTLGEDDFDRLVNNLECDVDLELDLSKEKE